MNPAYPRERLCPSLLLSSEQRRFHFYSLLHFEGVLRNLAEFVARVVTEDVKRRRSGAALHADLLEDGRLALVGRSFDAHPVDPVFVLDFPERLAGRIVDVDGE